MKMKKKYVIILVVVCIFLIYFIAKSIVTHKVKEAIDIMIEEISQVAEVEYDDISVSLLTRNTHIEDISIKPKGITDDTLKIKELIVRDYDYKSKYPKYVNFDIKKLTLTNIPEKLKDLGYKKFVADISLDWEYNSKKEIYKINELKIQADEMGELSLKLILSDVMHIEDSLEDANSIDSLEQVLENISIANAKITYKDDSIIEKLIKYDAEKEGVSYKKMRDEYVNKISSESFPGIPNKVLKMIKKFIKDPDTLKISISPDSPVSIKQLSKIIDRYDENKDRAEQIFRKLNIKISI